MYPIGEIDGPQLTKYSKNEAHYLDPKSDKTEFLIKGTGNGEFYVGKFNISLPGDFQSSEKYALDTFVDLTGFSKVTF